MQGPRQHYEVFLGWWIRRPVAGTTVAILLVLTLIWVPGIWREVPPPPSEQHPREQRPPEQHEQSASGPTRCMLAAERTAFDIRALQSQLMIDALKCGQRDGYNTFIRRHRGDLQTADKQIASHFSRIDNSTGQQRHDTYVTDLANAQSQEAIRQGSSFCQDIKQFVSQALTLQNPDQISRFVTEKTVADPYALPPCVPATTRTN